MNTPTRPLRATAVVAMLGFTLAASATSPLDSFLAAKRQATDSNYRNDVEGLRAAVGTFSELATDEALANRALYHAAWSEWMIAASMFDKERNADAVASLESGIARLRRILETSPDDAEAEGLLGWMLMGVATGDRTRAAELFPQVIEHLKRALELAPSSPRVVMLDATLKFYSPRPGVQESGLLRWKETLALVEAETVADPTLPDWGRALADGWLANLYISMTPPRTDEARHHAEKALRERPDFWWVATRVVPKIPQPPEG